MSEKTANIKKALANPKLNFNGAYRASKQIWVSNSIIFSKLDLPNDSKLFEK